MRRSIWCVGAVVLVAALAGTSTAMAQQGTDIETFTCESRNNGHHECRYNSSGTVTVHVNRQMSKSPCRFNESWGTFDGGVWVDYGCRAEFVVRRPPNSNDYQHRPVGGTFKTVTCESKNNSYHMCQVSNVDPHSVTIERKHSSSPCNRGSSWGVSEGESAPPGIWVDRGCRATFAYNTRVSSYKPYGGTPHDYDVGCVSEMSEWRHCEVPQIHLARLELIDSNSQCDGYKAWGTDETGIWVRSNCMGTWRVKYRH